MDEARNFELNLLVGLLHGCFHNILASVVLRVDVLGSYLAHVHVLHPGKQVLRAVLLEQLTVFTLKVEVVVVPVLADLGEALEQVVLAFTVYHLLLLPFYLITA